MHKLSRKKISLAVAALAAVSWIADAPAQKVVTKTPPPAQTSKTPTSREDRAQAYAKLLEGQRYLLQLQAVRETEAAAVVQKARTAFQEAARLDPTFAEAHTALARLAFEFPPQDLELAEREATLAVKLNPDNYGAQHILARFYSLVSGLRNQRQNRPAVEKALAALKEVVRLAPNDGEAWALLGELSLLAGRPEEAVRAFTRWTATPAVPDSRFFQFVTNGRRLSSDTAYSRLGEALIAAGRPAEAILPIRRAMELNNESDDYPRQLIKALEASGDTQQAVREMERIVATNPSNGDLLRLLARMKANAGQTDEAVRLLNAVLGKLPANHRERPLLRLNLAQIYAGAGRNDEAVAVYQTMLDERGITNELLQEDDPREFATTILGRVIDLQKNAGNYTAAQTTIARLRRLLGPTDSTADEQSIELLRETGRREEALAETRAARVKFPQDERFPRTEALLLTDLGRVEEGAKILRAGLTGTPADFGAYIYLSTIYAQARRGPEAVAAGQKALSLIPADLPQRESLERAALLTLSTAQERAGDHAGAEASLRRVLAQEADNTTALNNLGYFLVERNERLPEAIALIQRAVKAEPDNASFLDSLGWAYFKMDNLPEAERYLTNAVRRNPLSVAIQEHLGDLYQKLGKPEQARNAWQKALTLAHEPETSSRLQNKLDGKTK